LDISYYDRKANESQQKFDSNQQKFYQLKNWIENLKTQTNDAAFNRTLLYFSNELDALIPRYSGNLALATRDLYEIENGINSAIRQYNNQAMQIQDSRRKVELEELISIKTSQEYFRYNAITDVTSKTYQCNFIVKLYKNGVMLDNQFANNTMRKIIYTDYLGETIDTDNNIETKSYTYHAYDYDTEEPMVVQIVLYIFKDKSSVMKLNFYSETENWWIFELQ